MNYKDVIGFVSEKRYVKVEHGGNRNYGEISCAGG